VVLARRVPAFSLSSTGIEARADSGTLCGYGSQVADGDEDEELPSLRLVLDVLRSGRDERRGHFDALDQKAGLALGFSGVLITLSADVAEPWRVLGIAAAAIAAGFALAAFWPRGYEVLDNVRAYLRADMQQTQLVLVDTLAEMNLRTDRVMGTKATRLKVSLVALAVAGGLLGVGVIWHHDGGSHGRAHQGPGRHASGGATATATSSPR
jgi:hypothetical protein